MMIIAFEIIKSNPIFGIGINNYIHVAPFYDTTGLTYTYLQPVHNIYLQLAAPLRIDLAIVACRQKWVLECKITAWGNLILQMRLRALHEVMAFLNVPVLIHPHKSLCYCYGI